MNEASKATERIVSENAISASLEPGSSARTKHAWLWGFALVIAVAVAYQPVWHAGFIWDDDKFLVNNPLIAMSDGLYRFWFTTEAPDYFPMTSTSLWLEWRLWGNHALGYHLVNVLLHASSTVLLWRLLVRLQIPGAWLAAAIFALHPVNVESVAWITERKNTLAMVFYLLAIGSYLKFEDSRRQRWYWSALVMFALALLSKSAVVTLPFVLLGILLWRNCGRNARLVEHSWRESGLTLLPFFLLALTMGLITIWFQSHRAIAEDIVRTDGLASRLAVAGWAVWFYLGKVAWPLGLSFVYPKWQIDASAPLAYVPGLIVIAVLAASWIYRRRWGRVWFCSLGYFVVLLLPVLGFVNIYFMRYSLVADHWQYFAIIGPITLAAAGSSAIGHRWQNKWNAPGTVVGTICAAALLAALGTLTWRQARIYHDLDTLWADTLCKNPNCWMAYNNLGYCSRNPDEAIAYHRRALEIEPDNPVSWFNLANALLQKGDVDEAIACFQKTLELKPRHIEAQLNLGNALLQKGRANEAIACYQTVLKLKPDYAEAYSNLGNAQARQGNLDEAIAQYQTALQLQPSSAAARLNLGNALLQKGRTKEALMQFEQEVQLNPGDADAHNLLGCVLMQQGGRTEAITHFRTALQIKPNQAAAGYNLGCALLQSGNLDDAIPQFEKVLQSHPDHAQACFQLGIAWLESGKPGKAVPHFQKAVDLQPDYPDALNNLAWELATSPQPSVRDGKRAVELARRANELAGGTDPDVLDTLAAAFAEAGSFGDAIQTVRKAIDLVKVSGQADRLEQLNQELKLYEAGRPFHREGNVH